MTYPERHQPLINALRQRAAMTLPPESRMYLYGSRARKDSIPDSDWDIHILVNGDEHLPFAEECRIAMLIEAVGEDFDEVINARVHTYLGWEKRFFLPFYKNVERDSILIFEN